MAEFEMIKEDELMDVNGGGVGVVLLIIAVCARLASCSVGAYNGYKDTEANFK